MSGGEFGTELGMVQRYKVPTSALHGQRAVLGSKIPYDAYLMIIGAMKCGTTSLFHYLAQHPMICASHPKEPQYFTRHQATTSSVQSYQELWDFSPDRHRYVLEASTGYTKRPQEDGVARRIRRFGIKPRFIYIVRDPIARIESQFRHIAERGMATNPWPAPLDYAIALSRYHWQLSEYAEEFSLDAITIIDFDDLVSNPAEVVQSLLGKLDLPEASEIDYSAVNQSRQYRLARLNPLMRLLSDTRAAWRRRRSALPPRLSDADREYAVRALAEDMRRFSNQFGFDVSRWGFPGA